MTQQQNLTLTIAEGAEPIVLESTCLLIFVDETGHETFADQKYPVFGLAGAAIPVADYEAVVARPWRDIKDRFFQGSQKPLHAADLRDPTPHQVNALAQFFSDPRFSRFAAVVTSSTAIPEGVSPYQLAAAALMRRIELSTARYAFSRVALLVESSTRTDAMAEKYLGPYNKITTRERERTYEAPIAHFLLPKRLNEPGLEVADFVAQASGRHTLVQSQTATANFRKDFKAIYHAVPKEAVEFIAIERAENSDA